ncbi:MAG: C_GCAxxG_C_C family protein [Actinomycetia bacterium]|nr:C_GCAxxG_C_C family protein [Actinomycetes bacterium]
MFLTNNLNKAELGKKFANKYYKKRYNCAQSVLLATSKAMKINISKDLVRSAKVFSGGIGMSGCLCGALAGAILFIGNNYSGSEKKAKEFTELFKKEFGSTCCRVLKKDLDYKDSKLQKQCLKLTENTTRLLIEFIEGAI